MRVDVRESPDRVTLLVSGEVDYGECAELTSSLDDAVGRGTTTVAVALGGVTFFGSEGMKCLVAAKAKADAAGVDFVLVRPSKIVTSVLELVGLGDVFAIET